MLPTKYVIFAVTIMFKFITAKPNDILKNIEKTPSEEMQNFIKYIVAQHSAEKYGIVYVIFNEIPEIYNRIITSSIHCNSSAYVLNLYTKSNIDLKIGEKHFKITIGDPLGDISAARAIIRQQAISRAKTFLLLTNRPARVLVLYILKMYWMMQSLNVIIAYEDENEIKVLTYDPFMSNKLFVRDISKEIYGRYLFYNKLVNLNLYPIQALFTNLDRTKIIESKLDNGKISYSGKDYKVIQAIIQHINATLIVLKADDLLNPGEINPWSNSIKYINRTSIKERIVKNNNISLLLQSQMFDVEDEIFENIYPHAQDDLCVITPKSEQLTFIHELIHIFTWEAFVFYLLSPYVFTLLWIMTKKLIKRPYKKMTLFFHVIQGQLTNIIPQKPKNYLERILIIGWLHYSLVISISLQTKLTSILSKKLYANDIDTIEDLLKADVKIYGFENQINEIKKKYVGEEQSVISEKFIILSEFMEELSHNDNLYNSKYLGKIKNPILVYYDHGIFITRSRTYRSNGRPWAHLMRESILPSYRSFQATRGSPYFDIVSKVVRRLQEAGFITLWSKESLYTASIVGLIYPDEDYDDLPKTTLQLNLNHTIIAYYLLFIGLCVSTLVFCFELIYNQYKEVVLVTILQKNYTN